MHNIDYCLMSLYYIEKMYICNLLRNRTDIQKRQSFLVKATSIVGDRCNKCFVSSVMTLEYCRSFISFFNFILTYIFITIQLCIFQIYIYSYITFLNILCFNSFYSSYTL